jgi:hypothetical protein
MSTSRYHRRFEDKNAVRPLQITRNMYGDRSGCNCLPRESSAAPNSFQHPGFDECAPRDFFSRCRAVLCDLQPKMPHKPDGIEAQCRYPFDSECPTDALSQKANIDGCPGMPVCLRAKAAARDPLGACESGGIACHLHLRHNRGRQSCQHLSDFQWLGCHSGILLRLLSALRPRESVEVDNKAARKPANRCNQCPHYPYGSIG